MPRPSINLTKLRPLSVIKSTFVKHGQQPLRVPFGLFKGIILNLDLAHETQKYLGLWETETYKFIRTAMARCRWAVDVGAGSGELTLYLLLKSRSDAVHAFEPQETEIAKLRSNLVLNGLREDGRLVIHRDAVSINPNPGFVALDSIELDTRREGFLKIDVDGQEMHVLLSGTKLLSEGNVDVLVETHSEALESDCMALLETLGYSCSIIDNAWWRLLFPETRPIPHNRWLSATKLA